MGLLSSIRISASALTAHRLRMDVIANNVANMTSTRGPDGGVFQRQVVSFRAQPTGRQGFSALFREQSGLPSLPTRGVAVNRITEDQNPGRRVLDPSHPDADAEGFVEMPNVDLVVEMTDMVAAARAYEANVTVMNASKAMAQRALDIGNR